MSQVLTGLRISALFADAVGHNSAEMRATVRIIDM